MYNFNLMLSQMDENEKYAIKLIQSKLEHNKNMDCFKCLFNFVNVCLIIRAHRLVSKGQCYQDYR